MLYYNDFIQQFLLLNKQTKSAKLNIGSRAVKEARLKTLCVMLPGFESQSMYSRFFTAI